VLVVRAVWIGLFLLVVGLFTAAQPGRFAALLSLNTVGSQPVAQIGLSAEFYAWYHALLEWSFTGVCVLVGVFIFASRPDDLMAAIMSMALIMFGCRMGGFPVDATFTADPGWRWLIDLTEALNLTLSITSLYVFPTGRFFPKWSRFLAGALALWAASWVLFPNSPVNLLRWIENPTLFPLQFATQIGLYGSGIVMQIVRYRSHSNPSERQQTKWVVAGFALAMLAYIALNVPITSLAALKEPGVPRLIYGLVRKPFLVIGLSIVPVFFGVSILRFRLWDIDFLINRSVVYGLLTALLAAVFGAALLLMQQIARLVMGGDLPGLAFGGAAVAAGLLFQPARGALRRWVDYRLYGIAIDYRKKGLGQPFLADPTTHPTLSKYHDLTLIGRGGMAEIYRASHPTLPGSVAIKILNRKLAEDETARRRFEREAALVAKLQHRNIVHLHEFVQEGGMYFMVMEYINGPTLSELIRQGAMPLSKVLPILRDVTSALDYAHGQGLVHRDIKPSNVLLTASQPQRSVLTDFGIAYMSDATTRLTQTGMLGTLDYMSPEQIRHSDEVDARADIYALGIMAYHMLTGELPFKHSNPAGLLLAHLNQPAPDPRRLVPDLSEGAAVTVMQAMSKEPDHRQRTAGEFAALLAA
jgi:tRNA A-37 threonylcarbamoyl transferase component Bud32